MQRHVHSARSRLRLLPHCGAKTVLVLALSMGAWSPSADAQSLLYLKPGNPVNWTTPGATYSQAREIQEWQSAGYTVTTRDLYTTPITASLLAGYQVVRLNTAVMPYWQPTDAEGLAIEQWVRAGGRLLAEISLSPTAPAVRRFGVATINGNYGGPSGLDWIYHGSPLTVGPVSGPTAPVSLVTASAMDQPVLTPGHTLTIDATLGGYPAVVHGQFDLGRVVIVFFQFWSHDAPRLGDAYNSSIYQANNLQFLSNCIQYLRATPGDSDSDGLPDAWEVQFGLNPNSAAGDNGASGDPDHDGRTNLEEYQSDTHPRGFHARYFAEGAVIPGFFEVNIALLNVDQAAEAHVWLRFQREGATTVGHAVTVPARGRRTVRVNDIPVMGTPAYTPFSTVVESDLPVVADRTMVWNSTGYGSHSETSVASPAQTWYLAEGATHSGFALYYLIQNPNPTPISVLVTYLRPAPLAPVVRMYSVEALSRKTVYVNGEGPELTSTDVSAVIQSLEPAAPIIVERAMYLTDRWGHRFGAGHESAGVTAPSTSWFLAEGATVRALGSTESYFDLYMLIANPNPAETSVTTTYLLPDGTSVVRTFQVAGNSRRTVFVNEVDSRLSDTSLSTIVTATLPVIVERAMWWPGPTWATWHEAHNSAGTTATGTAWALAEGESGGSRQVETYFLIANTSAFPGQAKVTLLFEDGTPATAEQVFDLLPNSRRTIYPPWDFSSAVPAWSHRRYGAIIESLGTTPAQIVVERAIYANDDAGTTWAAGTNSVATRLR